VTASLLSFLPLSHIVALKRISANASFLFDLSILSNSQELYNNMIINMKIDTLRGQSASSSINSFRVSSAHLKFFSMVYIEHVQALTNNSSWEG